MDSSTTYIVFKHAHMTLALISFVGFIVRSFWAAQGSDLLQKKWVKISPHIIDTILLLSAIGLMVLIKVYPFTAAGAWLTAKLIALIAYIVFATFTLKKSKTRLSRLGFFTAAILSFAYIAFTAKTHAVVGLSFLV